ncbi:two-component system phosphate regulon sensor histidine kinase PhoR [Microbacterium testaceum]|nr:two-component system phosphate regulon sensor histidine kinase PhoR [Microbacterium sp. SORGH_AS_0969]MDQ1117400.1 two-component system phosphate regulon sensor histidine kinase PhoR [Microbacterium testaceum]
MVRAMPGTSLTERLGIHRSILSNQALLLAATLLLVVSSSVLGQVRDVGLFTVCVTVIFGGAILAILAPWRSLPSWALGLVPVIDMIAIAALRESAPLAGVGLLWAFPAIWIGSTFGVGGVVAVLIGVSAIVLFQLVNDDEQRLTAATFVLPFSVVALSALAHSTARRARAQRALLEKQSAELRRSVERARRQEDLVTEVLDAVDFGVIRVTREGDLAVTNEAHARLQATVDVLGEPIAAYAADGTTPVPPNETPLARARAGELFEGELVWFGAPGQDRRALSVTARRLSSGTDADESTIVVSRDVTAEEQALRARDDLVASVSHELRTPLTSIIGYLDLALDDPGIDAETRDRLEVAERNATRLRELVADILAMSASSRQGAEFDLIPVDTDIATIVRAAVESQQPRAADHGIRIDSSGVRPGIAHVDPRRLRQIVDNLLSNAIKYNVRGGTVTVAVEIGATSVQIAVADDGPGISRSEQGRVFDRFFRGDAVRNSSTHGSGLGLAISRDIVRAHGGEITVSSALGSGSTFIVRLPRKQGSAT